MKRTFWLQFFGIGIIGLTCPNIQCGEYVPLLQSALSQPEVIYKVGAAAVVGYFAINGVCKVVQSSLTQDSSATTIRIVPNPLIRKPNLVAKYAFPSVEGLSTSESSFSAQVGNIEEALSACNTFKRDSYHELLRCRKNIKGLKSKIDELSTINFYLAQDIARVVQNIQQNKKNTEEEVTKARRAALHLNRIFGDEMGLSEKLEEIVREGRFVHSRTLIPDIEKVSNYLSFILEKRRGDVSERDLSRGHLLRVASGKVGSLIQDQRSKMGILDRLRDMPTRIISG